MHGIRDNEVLLQTGYDVIVTSTLGGVSAIFHDGLWKSDHDFLIAFYSHLLVTMHGFRDNEVLLQTGYDVIVSLRLGGVSGDFSWGILKERPWLPILVVNGNFCPNSNGLEVTPRKFFTMSSIIKTRGNSYKLIVPNSRINARDNYFSVRIINVWNRLSDEMVNASNVLSFNYKLINTDLKFGLIGKP